MSVVPHINKYTEYPRVCLALGYLSAFCTGLSLPICIAVGIYLNVTVVNTSVLVASWEKLQLVPVVLRSDVESVFTTNVILYVLLIVMMFSFIMSYGLIEGAKKKDGGMLKSYVNYGYFVIAMSSSGLIRLIIWNGGNGPWYAYLLIVILWVIYTPLVCMVHDTYKYYEASGADNTGPASNKIVKEAEV